MSGDGLAGVRREAMDLDDYHLDLQIAVAAARRNVAAAWKYDEIVELWQSTLEVLDDVRRERTRLAQGMDAAVNPVETRAMTEEEVAAAWPDDDDDG